jgi:hypothetical protein
VEAEGTLPDAEVLRASLRFARSPSLVCVATDFLDWPSPLSEALVRLRQHAPRRARAVPADRGRDAKAASTAAQAYRDPEGRRQVFRFGADLRAGYLRKREQHFATVAQQCRAHDML